MYLKVDNSQISFQIEGNKLIARKFINKRLYTLVTKTPNSVTKLWEVLSRLEKLPDEFWKPLGL